MYRWSTPLGIISGLFSDGAHEKIQQASRKILGKSPPPLQEEKDAASSKKTE